MQLQQLAAALSLPHEGDPQLEIQGLAGLEDAREGELSFVTSPRYRRAFEHSRASAFLVPLEFDTQGIFFSHISPVFRSVMVPSPLST